MLSLRARPALAGAVALFIAWGCADPASHQSLDPDRELADLLAAAQVVPVQPPPSDPTPLVELGRVLFFDRILSGNMDVACHTCHHVAYHSTDFLSLSIGTGGVRTGPARRLGTARFLPRNSQDLYNKGITSITSLFHDGRVEQANGILQTPAGMLLPSGINSPLAAQALFPILGRDEMRGWPGDTTRLGAANELAALPDADPVAVWNAITRRVLSFPGYVALFRAAFPSVDSSEIGFEHAAQALAAFQRAAFTQLNTPFDRYLAGDLEALTDSAKRGAKLFFGRARCARCHTGALQTDGRFHNIGVPQLGPGLGESAPLDLGRFLVTGQPGDRFAFRTPSLRNVLLTGPWMHNGAYTRLDRAIAHYRSPKTAYLAYDPSQLDARLVSLVNLDPVVLATLDSSLQAPVELSDGDIQLLISFLKSLTDPAAINQLDQIPPAVPSGLPVLE